MILGLELRHFKTYKGQKYIPISTYNERISSFIGDNGIGKSSILEALDVLFNHREWNINLEAKNERGLSEATRNQPYLMGVFLIEQNKIKDSKLKELYKELTAFILSKQNDKSQILALVKDLIDKVDFNDAYFVVPIGKQYNNNRIDSAYFGTYDKEIKKIIRETNNIDENSLNEQQQRTVLKVERLYENYLKDTLDLYSYIYIPTEVDISEFSRIEKVDIQKLTGKNIYEEIEKIISTTSLSQINNKLEELVTNISNELYDYQFDTKTRLKNIQMQSLVSKIIEEFFSLRVLVKESSNKEKIDVKYLSSGEKRKALIELSKAFLMTQKRDDKYLIFAVDEPEASLNTRARFKQFEELKNIKKINGNIQILISTHWYGHLSIQGEGFVHLLHEKNNNIEIETYDLFNVREKINQLKKKKVKDLPNDITLKSINDLTQSIISSLQTESPYNWLICEGSSEKIYFEFYLKDLIETKNLVVLPVGGASEVKRIFEHLELPLKDYKESVKGKIFCIIDTDVEKFNFEPNKNIEKLVFKRLLNNENLTNLKENNFNINTPTEIEDCLEGKVFIEVLKQYEHEAINKILEDEKNIKDINLNSYYCFNLREDDKKVIKDFFDEDYGYRKIDFAKKYILKAKEKSLTPSWIEEIKSFFN